MVCRQVVQPETGPATTDTNCAGTVEPRHAAPLFSSGSPLSGGAAGEWLAFAAEPAGTKTNRRDSRLQAIRHGLPPASWAEKVTK